MSLLILFSVSHTLSADATTLPLSDTASVVTVKCPPCLVVLSPLNFSSSCCCCCFWSCIVGDEDDKGDSELRDEHSPSICGHSFALLSNY
jgi:hypothetical protein